MTKFFLTKTRWLVTIILTTFSIGQMLGTSYTDREFAFTSSSVSGWETNGDFNTSYYKFDAGEYAQTTAVTTFIPSGEVLDSDMDVKIACGRFGSWGNTDAKKKLTATVQLLDKDGNVLSSNSADFTGLTAGVPYKSAITVSKPANPAAVVRLKIILGSFYQTTDGCARFGGVKLTYSTKTAASCGTNPTVGTASLNGSISLSSFPVQTTGWTVGANCAWSDFGFVWSSSVNTPTLESNGTASSGCAKIQKATDGTSTSTSHSITGTFNTSTSYYVRGYGKNGYASGTYQYTDVLTITPRSVEFNSNGGSAVDTKYVNSGTKVTAPSDPTKTGYNFGEWQLNSSEFDFANTNVTSNITLVATWTAKTTTISFNQNSGTGGQTGTLTATYGSAMPSAPVTCPTRTGYDFGGYYDGSGGSGTQYYTNTGASARNWDKEDATYTLHAKWTLKSYTVTWKVNNENYSAGGQANVNHGNHITTLPSAPDPASYCGDKFMGWTDATDGAYVHGTSNLYTSASQFPAATGAQVFYAVFADYDE